MSDPDGGQEAALARLDALAHGLIAAAAPLRIDLARSPEEREAVYRLRYRVVVERGWSRPEDFPDGLERDEWDDTALQVCGWDGDTLVATGRLVFPADGRPLPTEAAFDIEIAPRGRVVDLGRNLSTCATHEERQRAFWAVQSRAWLELRARGFAHVCGVFSAPILEMYRAVGFRVTPLAPARRYWGEERYPISVDLPASAAPAADALTRTVAER